MLTYAVFIGLATHAATRSVTMSVLCGALFPIAPLILVGVIYCHGIKVCISLLRS